MAEEDPYDTILRLVTQVRRNPESIGVPADRGCRRARAEPTTFQPTEPSLQRAVQTALFCHAFCLQLTLLTGTE